MPTPEIRHVYELVGRITAQWNEAEVYWYLIFTCMLYSTPRPVIDAMWNHFLTGAAQRQFAIALADAVFREHPNLRADIGRLIALTNDAAGNRNAAVHAEYFVDLFYEGIGIRVAPGINRSKPNRLAGRELDQTLRAVLVEIEALRHSLRVFRDQLLESFVPEQLLPPAPPRQELLEAFRQLGFPKSAWER